MNDDQFDALMRDAARTYHRPRELPDPAALWAAIERALPADAIDAIDARPALTVVSGGAAVVTPRRSRLWTNGWLRAAAVLLLGVGLGRASVRRDVPNANVPVAAVAAAAPRSVDPIPVGAPPQVASAPNVARRPRSGPATPAVAAIAPVMLDSSVTNLATTSAYLGRAQALLAALPMELRAQRTDPAYLSRADALLLQTRLMLDSPAAVDPSLRSLFDDLEIVFAQVVRLKADRDPTSIDFLNQALEQRDVLPRLRDAVADNAGD